MKNFTEDNIRNILRQLHKDAFLETIYNTRNAKHLENGWTLKNGLWSPWYFNMRPVGASPRIVAEIATGMNYMIQEIEKEEGYIFDSLIGIEMAGVPLVSAIAVAQGMGTALYAYAYTRPLPGEKIRKASDAMKLFESITEDDVHSYGEKEFVEGRFVDNSKHCLIDDMVTDFESKLIARAIVNYEMGKRRLKRVTVPYAAVVLDREQGGEEQAAVNGMGLKSLIKFRTQGLEMLASEMQSEEYELIRDYQENPTKYQSQETQQEAIAMAKSSRAKYT